MVKERRGINIRFGKINLYIMNDCIVADSALARLASLLLAV